MKKTSRRISNTNHGRIRDERLRNKMLALSPHGNEHNNIRTEVKSMEEAEEIF